MKRRMRSLPTLKWFTVCRCGKLCANVTIEPVMPVPPTPPGTEVHARYVCGGCGVTYESWRKVDAR